MSVSPSIASWERVAAGTGDLPGQQLDDAVVLSVVVRFHDSVSVTVNGAEAVWFARWRFAAVDRASDRVLAMQKVP